MHNSSPTFGIIFHPKFPPETLRDYARQAEAAGFTELWLWDDCFLPGALTSATIALAATEQLKVGIGLLPATVYNPLFAAMEITTLARAFPERILPGFGYGFAPWMTQIGAAPKSYMKTLNETVAAVRGLLAGELVTVQADQVKLDMVQMQLTPTYVPPLYLGAVRERTLQLAGRIAEGTILTGMSSPAYVGWAQSHIRAGMTEAGRSQHRLVVYLDVKVDSDGGQARDAVRRTLAARLPWNAAQIQPLGIAEELAALIQTHGANDIAPHIPDAWLDAFSASGTPEQALASIQRFITAGADSIIFQPLDGDPDCLAEYIRYLMPYINNRYPAG